MLASDEILNYVMKKLIISIHALPAEARGLRNLFKQYVTSYIKIFMHILFCFRVWSIKQSKLFCRNGA
jgi:hypothetical protein